MKKKKEGKALKKPSKLFSEEFLKILCLEKRGQKAQLFWALPKAFIPHAVTRNKIKRWGRDSFKKKHLGLCLLIIALKKEKKFYKNLKRAEFDRVFEKILKKILKKRPS